MLSIDIVEDGRDFKVTNEDSWIVNSHGELVLSWRQLVALKRAIDVRSLSYPGLVFQPEMELEDG